MCIGFKRKHENYNIKIPFIVSVSKIQFDMFNAQQNSMQLHKNNFHVGSMCFVLHLFDFKCAEAFRHP